jgi:ubiquinone/menaquinone biosynthesis C-methylase UbiE|tara:strand:- start:587 stop:1270 length:684 start_codon:yes stop_codon:yes gene_type:complete
VNELRPALDQATLKTLYQRAARRYDRQHRLLTLASDQRGRELMVRDTVRSGDRVLDAGCGSGLTTGLAARAAGPSGFVTGLDLTPGMLDQARQKTVAGGAALVFAIGDMTALPFSDESFDSVLSSYSVCPLSDPEFGALELYRLVRPGGRLGIAHSAEPQNALLRRLAGSLEGLLWHLPQLSLGCRPVEVLPALHRAGARVDLDRLIGLPLWPFRVIVTVKPEASAG